MKNEYTHPPTILVAPRSKNLTGDVSDMLISDSDSSVLNVINNCNVLPKPSFTEVKTLTEGGEYAILP